MGNEPIKFDLDPTHRHKLLNGLDDIGQTLQQAAQIDGFEHGQKAGFPWLYRQVGLTPQADRASRRKAPR